VLAALGSSGLATVVAAFVTARTSKGKQDDASPNGERRRLQDEVNWLRRELERRNDSD
jgi:hypothetical protein